MAELYVPPSARKAPEEAPLYDMEMGEDGVEEEGSITVLSTFLVVLDGDGQAMVIIDPEHYGKYAPVKETTVGEVARACAQISQDLMIQRVTESVVVNLMMAQGQIAKVQQEQAKNAAIAQAIAKGGGLKGPQPKAKRR